MMTYNDVHVCMNIHLTSYQVWREMWIEHGDPVYRVKMEEAHHRLLEAEAMYEEMVTLTPAEERKYGLTLALEAMKRAEDHYNWVFKK